jgi:hypothetical protein
MIKEYGLLDRVSGKVLKKKNFKDIERTFVKPKVWLEMVREGQPTLDTTSVPDPNSENGTSEIAIQKAVRTVTHADSSDLSIPVPPASKITYGFNVVDMTAGEIQSAKDSFARGNQASYDKQLIKMLKRLMVVIATKPNAPPKRDDFPESDWDLINKLRAYDGELPI